MTTSYGSNAGADTYHADRGNTAWAAASEPDKTAARLRASEYIDATYRAAFGGYRTNGRDQDREWPREDAFAWERNNWVELPNNVVPVEVENATYEAALRELASPGALTPDYTPAALRKSVTVGALSVAYWSDSVKPVVEKIGHALLPLIDGNGNRASALTGSKIAPGPSFLRR